MHYDCLTWSRCGPRGPASAVARIGDPVPLELHWRVSSNHSRLHGRERGLCDRIGEVPDGVSGGVRHRGGDDD